MGVKPIWITENDQKRLKNLIEKNSGELKSTEKLREFENRLEKATVVEPKHIPEDVVTMNCLVRLHDNDTQEQVEYWLRFSADEESSIRVIPVLSDLGIELLGSREGDVIEWSGPSGKRSSTIVEIVYQPERLGNYEL